MSGIRSSVIPASDKSPVSRVREIVPNYGDDEIYAMLNECNKNLDETVQRLLNEGKFHVVRRKREKRREIAKKKSTSDSCSLGSSLRGVRNSGGSTRRIERASCLSWNESSVGRGSNNKVHLMREAGATMSKIKSAPKILSFSELVQPKLDLYDYHSFPMNWDQSSSLEAASWPASLGTVAPTTLQGAWLAGAGERQGTIIDVLKSNRSYAASHSVPKIRSDDDFHSSLSFSPVSTQAIPLPDMDALSLAPSASLEPSTHGVLFEDWSHHATSNESFLVNDLNIISSISGSLSSQHGAQHKDLYLGQQPYQLESVKSSNIVVTTSIQSSTTHEHKSSPVDYAEIQEGMNDVDQPEDEMSVKDGANASFDGMFGLDAASYPDSVSTAAAKMQELIVRDEHSVIIPYHLRVSGADCTGLSFGSFELGIGSLSSGFVYDVNCATASTVGDGAVNDVPVTPGEPVSTVRTVVFSTWEQCIVSDVPATAIKEVSTVSRSTTPVFEHTTEMLLPVENIVSSARNIGVDDSTDSRPEESSSFLAGNALRSWGLGLLTRCEPFCNAFPKRRGQLWGR